MGCDIHLHTEIKVGGKWLHYSHPRVNRWYRLFNRMAGVRGCGFEEDPISPPRGLPADATETIRFCSAYDGIDGHSHSWLSATEIAELENWCESISRMDERYQLACLRWSNNFGWLFGNSWGGFTKYGPGHNRYPDDLEDVRFVFWFDC